MNTTKIAKALLALGMVTASHSALALDFGGYFRAETGSNSEKGGPACFKLAGAGSKYRMGNECEIYGEFTFGQQVYKGNDGTTFNAVTMLSVYNPTAAGGGSLTSGSNDIGLPQIYISATNLPELNGATAWMGRRYYKREDIHSTDFFYWNPEGFGAGIEDYKVGDMKFSYALLRSDNPSLRSHSNPTTESASRHDFQLRDIGVNQDGVIDLGLSLVNKDSSIDNAHSGWAMTVRHTQNKILGDGWNKLAVQYGVGPGTGLGKTGDITLDTDAKRFRVVDGLYGHIAKDVSGLVTAVYQKDSGKNGASQVWTSLGARVTVDFTEHFKLNAEVGNDTVKPNSGASRNLTKFTIAPTLSSVPGFWARPELRLFYTYARWNDAARAAAAGSGDAAEASIAANGIFGKQNNGSTLGFQVEAWW